MGIFSKRHPSLFPLLDPRPPAASAEASPTTSSGGLARKSAHPPHPYDDAVGIAWRSTRCPIVGEIVIARSDAASLESCHPELDAVPPPAGPCNLLRKPRGPGAAAARRAPSEPAARTERGGGGAVGG